VAFGEQADLLYLLPQPADRLPNFAEALVSKGAAVLGPEV
jgi:hypothetical protein